jgi:SAM-dependent methyltransferase
MNRKFTPYDHEGCAICTLSELQKITLNSIKEKITEGIYKFQNNSCLCGNGKPEDIIISKQERFGIIGNIRICSYCGLVRNEKIFNDETSVSFYKNDYHALVFGSREPTYTYFLEQNERGYRFYSLLSKYLSSTCKYNIIEIGASAGGVLYPFVRRGHTCVGFEYNQEYANYGIARGIDIRPAKEIDALPDGYADVVILSHVLEHCADPCAMLHNIKRLISDTSYLIIEVPGIFNFHNEYPSFLQYLVIAHYFHFTEFTLCTLLKENGFSIIYSDEIVTAIAQKKINQNYSWHNTILAETILNFLELHNDIQIKQKEIKQRNKIKYLFENIRKVTRPQRRYLQYSIKNIKKRLISTYIVKKIYTLFISYGHEAFTKSNCINKQIYRYFKLNAYDITDEEFKEIQNRLYFYTSTDSVLCINNAITSNKHVPVLVFGKVPQDGKTDFFIDWRVNPSDGWEWCRLTNYAFNHKPNISSSWDRFKQHCLSFSSYDKAYIFGTGPSLEKAGDKVWDDGYRIVCNTIVRDKELWHHINPHIIIAADAIYHFGPDNLAKAFRKDLQDRLNETSTIFIYPDFFDGIISKTMSISLNQRIPIPTSVEKTIHHNLFTNFYFPGLGNVLPMLLTIGCSLSKYIYLWGFDGRAPSDSLFWSNSPKHSYVEFIAELQKSHPAFFHFFVPKENPLHYIHKYHGLELEGVLSHAKNAGWHFTMLHDSWTPVLNALYRKAI